MTQGRGDTAKIMIRRCGDTEKIMTRGCGDTGTRGNGKTRQSQVCFAASPCLRVSASLFSSVICFFTILFFLVSCSSGAKGKQMMPKPVPVLAAAAVLKDVPVQLTAIGNVEAYSTVEVNSRIGGQLVLVHFKEGQDVNKGDILFTIDPRPFEAALKQAEANLVRDTAQLNNARQQEQRYQELVKKGYVSQADYDQMRTNADALEATVKADKAAVENARLQLTYCFIYSPITGRTGNLLVHQGNIIKENDKTIVTINQVQPIYVSFNVPEQRLAEIKKYSAGERLKVIASFPQSDGIPLQGELTFIDNSVDRTTGTIRLKATFANSDRRLWPGQFVNVTLNLTTRPNAIVAPSQAIQTGQQGQYVFVIRSDATVEMRPVAVSMTVGSESVIDKGVAPGEQVVTDGQLRLIPGAKVEIKVAQ
ncbi:MAG: efflux RND transporter periplasmic adaptor subunit [Dissulfurispiraceae bacterium]